MSFCSICLIRDRKLSMCPDYIFKIFESLLPVAETAMKLCWECLAVSKRFFKLCRMLFEYKGQYKTCLKVNAACKTNTTLGYSRLTQIQISNQETIDKDSSEKTTQHRLTNESNDAKDKPKNKPTKGRTKNKTINRISKKKPEKSYLCKECNKLFTSRGKYDYHKQKHRGPVKCDICQKRFSSGNSLWSHKALYHPSTKFKYCDKAGSEECVVKKEHDELERFYCGKCEKFFKNRASLQKHLRVSVCHVDSTKLKYACKTCNRKFPTANSAKAHESSHKRAEKCRCAMCPKSYMSRRAMHLHMRLKHNDVVVAKNYVCEKCGKDFKTKQELTNHTRVHSGERPFVCEDCKRGFAQRSALITHIRALHTKIVEDKR